MEPLSFVVYSQSIQGRRPREFTRVHLVPIDNDVKDLAGIRRIPRNALFMGYDDVNWRVLVHADEAIRMLARTRLSQRVAIMRSASGYVFGRLELGIVDDHDLQRSAARLAGGWRAHDTRGHEIHRLHDARRGCHSALGGPIYYIVFPGGQRLRENHTLFKKG